MSNCTYKVKIKDIQNNYKVIMEDIQNKYKFKIFCSGGGASTKDVEYLQSIVNQLPKVSDEGTDVSLTPTIEAKISSELKGNTSQSGGPTPDTPIPVNVVSGDNTIIVSNSDNTQSQSYSISLGSIELCKIDTYEDKIYSSNGRFYLYKKIGKTILNGSESAWSYNSSPSTPTPRTVAKIPRSNYDYSKKYYSNRLIYGDTSTSNRLVLESNAWYLSLDNALTGITSSDTNAQKMEKIKTYLSNNNIEVYYVLETPTTTEITDSTLISQLNALQNAMSYKDTTNITSTYEEGNAQVIINASTLYDLNALISG